ncbi:Eukaryotic translation initiation factor 3 subunit K, partial [Coemansia sp. RSA 2611]
EVCKDASIAKLLALRESLERAQFVKFWRDMYDPEDEEEESVVDGIAGFDNGLRKLILAEITATYQKIPLKDVQDMVNLDEEAVLRLAKENGWTVDGPVISLPLKAEVKA